MKIVIKCAILAFILTIASGANACPGGLRPFNKQLGGKDTCIIEETIVGDLTLTSGYNYILLGPVFVGKEIREKQPNGDYLLKSPVQPGSLTVLPGVKIYGLNPVKDQSGVWDGVTFSDGVTPVEGDIKSFLSITRDSKINVEGSATAPVLITSAQTEYFRPALSAADREKIKKAPGDWGGLVINGYGKSNKCTTFAGCTLPGEANTGFYGGDDNDHSSGALQYLQIEFGGDRIDTEKELNGVTFNGVGLGTKIENLAVLYNSDDCIEFFGGVVTGKNIFCYKGEDDGVDVTDGARVFLQNGVVVAAAFTGSGQNDRHAVEADSSKNADAHGRLGSDPILVNFTFVGAPNSQGLMIRRSSNLTLVNSLMLGFDLWCLTLDGAGELALDNNVLSGCQDVDAINSFTNNTFLTDAGTLALSQWVPTGNSPLHAGAIEFDVYSDDQATDPVDQADVDEAFDDAYELVPYRGAVGTTDWTSWIDLK